MKRFLAILMVLTLAFCCFVSCAKNDANGETNNSDTGLEPGKNPAYRPDVKVEGGELELRTNVEGETLYVSVVVTGNPGVACFGKVRIEFDNTKCTPRELVGSEVVADLDSFLTNLDQGEIDKTKLAFVSTAMTRAEDLTADGILFTVAFDITDATAEDFGLSLNLQDASFSNQKKESVLFTAK